MKRLLVALLAALPSSAWAMPDAGPVAAWVAEASQQGPVVLLSPDREALVAVKTHPLLEGIEVESRSACAARPWPSRAARAPAARLLPSPGPP